MANDGTDQPFDAQAARYDAWFDSAPGCVLFANEVEALRALWGEGFRPALEVGVGTGRFARALGVGCGVDPAAGARTLAGTRGIAVTEGRGEALPFAGGSFAGVTMVTALGFMADPEAAVREAARVLRPGGRLLVGEIARESAWGRACSEKRNGGDPFFRGMRLFSVEEIEGMMTRAGLEIAGVVSTLVSSAPGAPRVEAPERGRVAGAGFVAVAADKRAG